ncbi:MAG: hypothetical protein ACRC3B_23205 [Bacteroidia bacterium]
MSHSKARLAFSPFDIAYPMLKSMMEKQRGFVQFGSFSDELLAKHRSGVTDVNQLHTHMLNWMGSSK